jgi:hypothetical protein
MRSEAVLLMAVLDCRLGCGWTSDGCSLIVVYIASLIAAADV